jgi:hypothetical protein
MTDLQTRSAAELGDLCSGTTKDELCLYVLRDVLSIHGERAKPLLREMEADIESKNYNVLKYLNAYVHLVETNGNGKK